MSVRRADVAVATGRVHAVVGENGAGKTTLLRIAAGLVVPDSGTVRIEGSPLVPHTAAEALRRGVGMVQQHFALVPVFSVLENLVLGAEPRGLWGLSLSRAREAATRALQQVGHDVPLDAIVEDLGVGDRQRVEIARMLFRGARTLILDEPTAVLTAGEADALYTRLRVLAGAGAAVVVVTHKLDEVLAYADVVTVMRRGQVIETRSINRGDREEERRRLASSIMGGSDLSSMPPRDASNSSTRVENNPTALVVDNVRLGKVLDGVSLSLREGEVVGIAGIEGNGQDELLRILGGLEEAEQGRVECPGGMAVVYGDRHGEGLVLGASVLDNLMLGELGAFSRSGLLNLRALRDAASQRLARAEVVPPDLDLPVSALSGGNQQKIVVERALARVRSAVPATMRPSLAAGSETSSVPAASTETTRARPKAAVLVLSHPTRGVDIGAARAIHERLRRVANDSKVGMLVLSSDLDELRALCHRVLVIARGRIVASLTPETSDAIFGETMLSGAVPAGRASDRPLRRVGPEGHE